MVKEFDPTLKTLLEIAPVDWPRFAGHRADKAYTINADTSILSGSADKAILVKGKPDWVMHFEFQSGPDASLPRRMNRDNSILEDRTGLQV